MVNHGKQTLCWNLAYQTTGTQLEALFAQAGTVVEAVVIQERDTGRSKGFGFVEMADEATAAAAIERFNGTELDDRTLKVAEAKPRAPRRDSYSRDRW